MENADKSDVNMTGIPDDDQIVNMYWERNEYAVTATKARYEHYLMKIAMNILYSREDSEEKVNDTYFRAWNAMPPERPAVLRIFLGRITRRLSIDMYRKKHSLKRIPSDYMISLEELDRDIGGAGSPEIQITADELMEAVEDFLKKESEQARVLFIGRYYYCDSVKDLMKYYQMSGSAVKSLLYRTRKRLAVYLRKEGLLYE